MRPEILFPLFACITTLSRVGSSAQQALARLIHGDEQASVTLRDVLFHLPGGMLDRRFSPELYRAPADTVCTFQVKIEEHFPPGGGRMSRGGKKPYKVLCSNATGDITLVFFHANGDYIQKSLPIDEERLISGRTEIFDFKLQMTHPDIIARVSDRERVMVMEPQYSLTAGLSNKRLCAIIEQALAQLPELPEWLPAAVIAEHGFASFKASLLQAHHPVTEADISPESPARVRLALDELLAEQVLLQRAREKTAAQPGIVLADSGGGQRSVGSGQGSEVRDQRSGDRNQEERESIGTPLAGGESRITPPVYGGEDSCASGAVNACTSASTETFHGIWQQLEKTLPFTLTTGQREVLADIARGLASGTRYVRLLQGDVGSGKTIIALFAMLRAVEHGTQAAMMVPTEIVAQQHFMRISEMCWKLDISVVFLTGSVKGAARKRALEHIADGSASIIIGTHALFQEHVKFHALALAVIDEQHRFGVNQRMALVEKGAHPHLLHMTATPIPRSLMMTYYGDMQPLLLKEKPYGRKSVVTRVIPISRSKELLARLEAAISRGEKAYWICPQIEETTAEGELFARDIAAVEARFTEFKTRFAGKVALVHGRMSATEREANMRAFSEGDCQLLVATTVIEVGVDVPSATIMIIEGAERFGLSQLHQLRGRVGRSDAESFCILLYSDHAEAYARERLLALREHEDGFAIAEMDFRLRGGGELIGKKQSGSRRYRLADSSHVDPLLPLAHRLVGDMPAEMQVMVKELMQP